MISDGEYSAWAAWLEAFGDGSDLPSLHLPAVDEAMGPFMQSRVIERVARAFETRAVRWARVLERDVGAVTDPTALAAAMISARARLAPLIAFADDARLPEAVRDELRRALISMVRSAQENLDHSARQSFVPPGQLAAVLDNDLRRALAAAPVLPPPAGPSSTPRGRRVIL